MRTRLLTALLLLQACFAQDRAARPSGSAVFRTVFSGITAAAVSDPLPNVGQSMHLLTVLFPLEPAAVSGLQVRLEASFDNVLYFPISADITAAPLLGGRVYQIERAYAPFPYVRVRSLQPTGGRAMTVIYSGHLVPVVPFITQQLDRFLL